MKQRIEEAIALLQLALQDDEPTPAIPWLHTARGELGVREVRGPKHDARVLEYLATCSREEGGNLGKWGAGRDETPWCSAFVNWCLLRTGIEGTRNARARSWLEWGSECGLRKGCVVVLSRTGGGHVGFYDHTNEAGELVLLGGNQSNSVSLASYDAARAIGYRWPATEAVV